MNPTQTEPATTATQTTPAAGFADLEHEGVIDELPVNGELPSWLSGSLIRVAPAQWDLADEKTVRHWFDGQAMLHHFGIKDGKASYANKFLATKQRQAIKDTGKLAYSEFASDPCRSLFKRVQTTFSPALTDNANVNVTQLGERFIAMTETPIPVEFDLDTLDTLGVAYKPPGEVTTAHPHLNRADKGMLNFAIKFGPRNSYRFFELGPDATDPRVVGEVPVKNPAYQHAFGVTERWFVLTEFPFRVNPMKLLLSGRPFIENFEWNPDEPTRITLIDRKTGEIGHVFETDACFAFHHVNAYEDGDEVIVDICASADPSIIDQLFIDRLRSDKPITTLPYLERLTLNVATGAASIERLSDAAFDLPRINYGRCNERPYRYTWGAGFGGSGWIDEIVKIDVQERSALRWSEPGAYPGEPVFVAEPDAQDEDAGVLLSVVFDAPRGTSYLLALDARSLDELARAEVPHHIPFGFHGQFARA